MKFRFSSEAQRALTFVEVLVAVAAITLLAVVFLPKLLPRACCKAQRINCVNNLKQVGLSFRIWSGDNDDQYPMQLSVTNGGTMEHVANGEAWPHFQIMSNELNTPKVLVCPQDKRRTAATNFVHLREANLSYFVGVDAEESKPTMLLAGDDNLTVKGKPVVSGLLNLWTNSAIGWNKPRHSNDGNICFADGSVQQINSKQLREALIHTFVATNRLAMP